MYKWFRVKNFRCFKNLRISNLNRVNLIAGRNNVGKTALIEALFIHSGMSNPALTLKVNAFRGLTAVRFSGGWDDSSPWDSLFLNFDNSKIIEFKGTDRATGTRQLRLKFIRDPKEIERTGQYVSELSDQTGIHTIGSYEVTSGNARILELSLVLKHTVSKHYMIIDQKGLRTTPIPPSPPFPGRFLTSRVGSDWTEYSEKFGKLQKSGQVALLLNALRKIEPKLQSLAVVVTPDGPIIHGAVKKKALMPLPLMGEGMARLTRIVLDIATTQQGVILIDEIENGVHHTVMQDVWSIIREVSSLFDVQVFTTTHSRECIAAAHRSFSESKDYDFGLYRLERHKDTIEVQSYNQRELEAALDTGLEVR